MKEKEETFMLKNKEMNIKEKKRIIKVKSKELTILIRATQWSIIESKVWLAMLIDRILIPHVETQIVLTTMRMFGTWSIFKA